MGNQNIPVLLDVMYVFLLEVSSSQLVLHVFTSLGTCYGPTGFPIPSFLFSS